MNSIKESCSFQLVALGVQLGILKEEAQLVVPWSGTLKVARLVYHLLELLLFLTTSEEL